MAKKNKTKSVKNIKVKNNDVNPSSSKNLKDNNSRIINSKTNNSKLVVPKISNDKKIMIEEVVKDLVGDEGISIVFYLIGKTRVSEFTVAQDLDLEIHKARNTLYKLLEHNILYFHRKKDKIKGWYICYWDFNEKVIPFLHEKILSNRMQKMRERLDKESSSTFYMCKSACIRMDFEKAMEFNFKCPECGELMDEQNNSRTVESLQERIRELGKKIKQQA